MKGWKLTQKVKEKTGRIVPVLLITFLLSFSGCLQQEEEKVPVIEVDFAHYIISDQHVVKINSVKKVEVELEKVRVTRSPPFPGIFAYAIYPKDDRVLVSPVAYTSVNTQGDNIVLYIGIEKDELPDPGTRVNVFVEVWDKNSNKLAADRGELVWE